MSDENKSLIQRLKHSARYEASNSTADPAQPNQSDATAPLEPEKRLGLLWTGNDGWLMTDGSLLIATDLDFYLSERLAPPPMTLDELGPELDLLMITHEHDDHFNARTVAELINKSHCHFLLPLSGMEKAVQIGIPDARRHPIKPGEHHTICGIDVLALRALHGHIGNSIYKGANLDDCGYYFELAGQTIYQPGDTVLLQEHLEMPPVDLLFVSPTEHNTYIQPSIDLIQAIHPNHIFCQHFNTYRTNPDNAFWTRGYPQELKAGLPEEVQSRLTIPKQGEIYLL